MNKGERKEEDAKKIKEQLKGKQLKGKECTHSRKIAQTNSKGKEFWECEQCGAFLGWV